MSFWSLAYRSSNGGHFQVPFMSDAGGNTVFLAPNGVTTFVFTDHGSDSHSLNSPVVAEVIRPFPETGLSSVDLLDRADTVWPFVTGATIATTMLAAGVVVVTRDRRRARRSSDHSG